MKRNVMNLENFQKNELSNEQKKGINGGGAPLPQKEAEPDSDGEPVTTGTNGSGDGTRNDHFPIDPIIPTVTS